MNPDIDNQMLVGLAREDRLLQHRSDREAEAARMLREEFIQGLAEPMLAISTPGYGPTEQTQALIDVVIDMSLFKGQLLADLLKAAGACDDAEVLRALAQIADAHTENHVSLMAAEGAFNA